MIEAFSEGMRRAQRVIAALYVRERPGGITLSQIVALQALVTYGPQSQRGLVRQTKIDRSTTGSLIGSLLAKGFVARVRNERDTRAWTVSHTPAGREELRRAMKALEKAEREALKALPDEHVLAARRVLATVSAYEIGELG